MDSTNTLSKFYQHALFLKAWIKSPSQVGSIIPSSDILAKRVAKVASNQSGLILELGAGTGSLTQALVNSSIPNDRLLIIELDQKLCDILKKRFPDVNIIQANACYLNRVLIKQKIKPNQVGAIVSSLPFLSLPSMVTNRVLMQIFNTLTPDSPLIQYTYGPRSPVPKAILERYERRAKRVETIIRNIPPATVWTF